MKKLCILITLCVFSFQTHSQNFAWAKQIGGPNGTTSCRNITIDGNGNIYSIGGFDATADFDPGPGIFNMSAHQIGYTDVFLSKLDAAGDFVWARQFGGGSFYTNGNAVAIDAVGNVYITGNFYDTCDFDPGPGVFNLIAPPGTDYIFICKLDSNGNFRWAKGMGSMQQDGGTSIAVDANGNSYTTGYFSLTVDFDPGPGVFNITVYGPTFDSDDFILKLDSAGNFVWAKRLGGTDSEWAYKIILDANGNIYTAGFFSSTTADFDPGPATYTLTSAGDADIFVSKLDSAGNFVWAKRMGGSAREWAYSMAVDAAGNVFTTGYFNGTADFDPGTATFNLTSAGMEDIFISKLDSSGNFVWAKKTGSTLGDYGYSIALDSAANVYTTGYFQLTTDFDPGPGTYNLNVVGASDIFVCKLDSSGNFIWADGFGSSGYETGYSLAVDASANVYTTGSFLATVDFDPGSGTFNMTPFGYSDVFVVKLSDVAVGINENSNSTDAINIYPNPSTNYFTIALTHISKKVEIIITDISGKIIYSVSETEKQNIKVNADDFAQGIYLVKIQSEDFLKTEKLIVTK